DGIRDFHVTGVQTCALPISRAEDGRHDRRHDENDTGNQQRAVALHQGLTAKMHGRGSGLAALNDGFVGLAHALPSTPMRPCGLMIRISAMAANSMTSE